MSTGGQVLVEAASAGASSSGTHTLTASTDYKLAAENHERDKLIVSTATADIWLAYGTAAAVLNQGIVVRAGAAPYVESDWKGEVHVISSGAAVVSWTEESYQTGDSEGEQPAGAQSFVPSGPSDTSGVRVATVTAGWKPGVKWPPNA